MLGALVGKLQQLVNHGGRREGHITLILWQLTLPVLHDLRGQLPLLRVAEHLRVLLHAQAQAVLLDEVVRVGVVGQHGRVRDAVAQFLLGRFESAAAAQGVQAGAHAVAQLGGGLAGEGHAEHFLGAHEAVVDQPNHAVDHGRGLARTGTGDDEGRGGAGLNHADLLGCGFLALGAVEHRGDVEGATVAARGGGSCGQVGQERAVGELPGVALAPLGGGERLPGGGGGVSHGSSSFVVEGE